MLLIYKHKFSPISPFPYHLQMSSVHLPGGRADCRRLTEESCSWWEMMAEQNASLCSPGTEVVEPWHLTKLWG